MYSIFTSFLQELTITQTRKKYHQCEMPYPPDLNRSKELPAKDILVPRFTEGRKGGSARFSQTAAPEWQSWDVHPQLPDSKLFPTVPGCTSGKLSHAGTSPAGYGGRESRSCRPPQPMPTPGRPPGHPPELTLGVRAATNSPPPLHDTAPASRATYLVVPAARPRAPRPRRPAPRGSLETPPAPVARVTSRLPTSKPLRARPRGNCSFSLRSSALKRAWRAGAAGSRRRTTAPPSGSRSLQDASVQLQSPEDFRSPEGREAGRRVLCSLQPASLALYPARPVSPFSQPRPPSPSAQGTFNVPLHRAGVYYPEPASLGRGG